MLTGTINCSCGQSLYFETVSETIECPVCKMLYKSADHANPEPKLTEEIEEANNEQSE